MRTEQIHRTPESSSCYGSEVDWPGVCGLFRFPQGPPVIYASTDAAPGRKRHLAQRLLRERKRIDPHGCIPADGPLTLHKTTLGAPFLRMGNKPGPPISFSRGNGRLWAAMGSREPIGIDVAFPDEFAGSYPFDRAFKPEELALAKPFCKNDRPLAAALVWSVKEAAVKAVGTGFNHFDPLAVAVRGGRMEKTGIRFAVLADRPIWAWARAQETGWLSLALVSAATVLNISE